MKVKKTTSLMMMFCFKKNKNFDLHPKLIDWIETEPGPSVIFDRELLLLLVEPNGKAIQYGSKEIKDDKNIVLDSQKYGSGFIGWVAERILKK